MSGDGGGAAALAGWACGLRPGQSDRELALRSLRDTVAVALAARGDVVTTMPGLDRPGRWAAAAHVLDYDDLHLPSTAHLSAVCVPAALAVGGGARAYLAGVGVMARLGTALGWRHYSAGWHATCTAGAPAAAVAAAVGMDLTEEQVARALVLALPAAGGVQRAFGTMAKSLQVGFAVSAGVRAAQLSAAGASADLGALEQWLELVGAGSRLQLDGELVPGGLAVKTYPCCYALQRPMAAAAALEVEVREVERIRCRTMAGTLQPLIHGRPQTGLEGKFSLEYGLAAALLDRPVGRASFEDAAVCRPEARRLMEKVEVEVIAGGTGLLDGSFEIEATDSSGRRSRVELAAPPGAPGRPLTEAELQAKVADCCGDDGAEVLQMGWEDATLLLERAFD